MDFGGWRQSSCTRATIWAYCARKTNNDMVLNQSGNRIFIGWMMDHKVCAQYGLTRNLSLEVFFNIIMLLSTLQLIYNRKMTKKKSKTTRDFLLFGQFSF
jgi:hypothetical protein